MVASRWPWRLDFLAAAIKRTISAVVRYSRVRTEEFTVVGADRPPLRISTIFCQRFEPTGELSNILQRQGTRHVAIASRQKSAPATTHREASRRAHNGLMAMAS